MTQPLNLAPAAKISGATGKTASDAIASVLGHLCASGNVLDLERTPPRPPKDVARPRWVDHFSRPRSPAVAFSPIMKSFRVSDSFGLPPLRRAHLSDLWLQ